MLTALMGGIRAHSHLQIRPIYSHSIMEDAYPLLLVRSLPN